MNFKRCFPLQFVASVTAFCFLFSSLGNAAALPAPIGVEPSQSLSIKDFHLPESLGSVEFRESASAQASNVILIQDAHALVDAQIKIQKLIQYLNEKHGIDLVALEGSRDEWDTTLLRNFPDDVIKKKVFSGYLQRAEITGAGMAALLQTDKVRFHGMENWDLYEKNYSAYARAARDKEKALKALADVRVRWDAVRQEIFPQELNSFFEKEEAFRHSKTQLGEWMLALLQFQKNLSPSEQTALANRCPHVAALGASLRAQQNPGQASQLELLVKQKAQAFQKKIFPRISAEDQKTFNARYQSFRSGQEDPGHFFQFLNEMGGRYGFRPRMENSLRQAYENSRTLASLKGTRLFEELEAYTQIVREPLIENARARNLLEQYKSLRVLENLARLEWTHEELESYQKNPQAYLELLKNPESGISAPGLFSPALEFYKIARSRELGFDRRVRDLLKKENRKTIVVIAGGFHAEGIKTFLKASGYSYAVVMPRMASLEGQDQYAKIMSGQLSYQKYIHDSLYDAFARAASLELVKNLGIADFRRILKAWRDEVIRDLARQGRAGEASRYTRYIDRLFQTYLEKFGGQGADVSREDLLKTMEEASVDFRREKMKAWHSDFETSFKAFGDGLQNLIRDKQLTLENISLLLRGSPSSPATAGVLQLSNAAMEPDLALGRAMQNYLSPRIMAGLKVEIQPDQLRSELRVNEDLSIASFARIWDKRNLPQNSSVMSAIRLAISGQINYDSLPDRTKQALKGFFADYAKYIDQTIGFEWEYKFKRWSGLSQPASEWLGDGYWLAIEVLAEDVFGVHVQIPDREPEVFAIRADDPALHRLLIDLEGLYETNVDRSSPRGFIRQALKNRLAQILFVGQILIFATIGMHLLSWLNFLTIPMLVARWSFNAGSILGFIWVLGKVLLAGIYYWDIVKAQNILAKFAEDNKSKRIIEPPERRMWHRPFTKAEDLEEIQYWLLDFLTQQGIEKLAVQLPDSKKPEDLIADGAETVRAGVEVFLRRLASVTPFNPGDVAVFVQKNSDQEDRYVLRVIEPSQKTTAPRSEVRASDAEKADDLRARINTGVAIMSHGRAMQVSGLFTAVLGRLSGAEHSRRNTALGIADLTRAIQELSLEYDSVWAKEAERLTGADYEQNFEKLEIFRTGFLGWVSRSQKTLKKVDKRARTLVAWSKKKNDVANKRIAAEGQKEKLVRELKKYERSLEQSESAIIDALRLSRNLEAIKSLFADSKNAFEDLFLEAVFEGEESSPWRSKGEVWSKISFHQKAGVPSVKMNAELFHIAFERIWENAVLTMSRAEISPEDQVVDVYADYDESRNKVRLISKNYGKIPEDILPDLFKVKYARLEFHEGGVGLPFVAAAIKHMGGTIKAENINEDGKPLVQFTIEFPAAIARSEIREASWQEVSNKRLVTLKNIYEERLKKLPVDLKEMNSLWRENFEDVQIQARDANGRDVPMRFQFDGLSFGIVSDGKLIGALSLNWVTRSGGLAVEIGLDMFPGFRGLGLGGLLMEVVSAGMPDSVLAVGKVNNFDTLKSLTANLAGKDKDAAQRMSAWADEWIKETQKSRSDYNPQDDQRLRGKWMGELADYYSKNPEKIPGPEVLWQTVDGKLLAHYGKGDIALSAEGLELHSVKEGYRLMDGRAVKDGSLPRSEVRSVQPKKMPVMNRQSEVLENLIFDILKPFEPYPKSIDASKILQLRQEAIDRLKGLSLNPSDPFFETLTDENTFLVFLDRVLEGESHAAVPYPDIFVLKIEKDPNTEQTTKLYLSPWDIKLSPASIKLRQIQPDFPVKGKNMNIEQAIAYALELESPGYTMTANRVIALARYMAPLLSAAWNPGILPTSVRQKPIPIMSIPVEVAPGRVITLSGKSQKSPMEPAGTFFYLGAAKVRPLMRSEARSARSENVERKEILRDIRQEIESFKNEVNGMEGEMLEQEVEDWTDETPQNERYLTGLLEELLDSPLWENPDISPLGNAILKFFDQIREGLWSYEDNFTRSPEDRSRWEWVLGTFKETRAAVLWKIYDLSVQDNLPMEVRARFEPRYHVRVTRSLRDAEKLIIMLEEEALDLNIADKLKAKFDINKILELVGDLQEVDLLDAFTWFKKDGSGVVSDHVVVFDSRDGMGNRFQVEIDFMPKGKFLNLRELEDNLRKALIMPRRSEARSKAEAPKISAEARAIIDATVAGGYYPFFNYKVIPWVEGDNAPFAFQDHLTNQDMVDVQNLHESGFAYAGRNFFIQRLPSVRVIVIGEFHGSLLGVNTLSNELESDSEIKHVVLELSEKYERNIRDFLTRKINSDGLLTDLGMTARKDFEMILIALRAQLEKRRSFEAHSFKVDAFKVHAFDPNDVPKGTPKEEMEFRDKAVAQKIKELLKADPSGKVVALRGWAHLEYLLAQLNPDPGILKPPAKSEVRNIIEGEESLSSARLNALEQLSLERGEKEIRKQLTEFITPEEILNMAEKDYRLVELRKLMTSRAEVRFDVADGILAEVFSGMNESLARIENKEDVIAMIFSDKDGDGGLRALIAGALENASKAKGIRLDLGMESEIVETLRIAAAKALVLGRSAVTTESLDFSALTGAGRDLLGAPPDVIESAYEELMKRSLETRDSMMLSASYINQENQADFRAFLQKDTSSRQWSLAYDLEILAEARLAREFTRFMAQVMAVGYSKAKPLTPSQFTRVKRGTYFMAVISEDAPARVPDLLRDQLLFAGEGHVQGAVNILGWKRSMNLFDLLLRQSIADQGSGKRHVLDQKTLDAAINFINRLAETAAAREAIARAA